MSKETRIVIVTGSGTLIAWGAHLIGLIMDHKPHMVELIITIGVIFLSIGAIAVGMRRHKEDKKKEERKNDQL